MRKDLVSLPMDCASLINGKPFHKANFDRSIRQHIHLIVRTHHGEYRYDPSFGCLIWDKDFETIRSVNHWKEELLEAFSSSIKKFETRLKNIDIKISLNDMKIADPKSKKLREIRKQIVIDVNATIKRTNESFFHQEQIYFSPLSLT